MSSIFWTEQTRLPKTMKVALIGSALFHIALAIAGTIGLPFIQKPMDIPPPPISVDILDIADQATTDKPPSPQKLKPVKDKPKIEKKLQAPPKVEAKAPPKVEPVKKPPEKKKETVKPKPKTPPPPSAKAEKPKPPEPKKEEPKKEEIIQEEDPMASLLRNLQESEPTAAENAPDAPLAPTMTAHELSALSNQLIGCWQIPIGAKNIQDMVVNVRVWPRNDRTVRKVEIANEGWLNSDPAFRALAESARRAVQDPRCNPLELPMDKFEVWKDKYIEVPFDPSKVL